MVYSVSGCTRGVQVKLRDPLRTHAIPERLRGVITTRRYTKSTFTLPHLTYAPLGTTIDISQVEEVTTTLYVLNISKRG